MYVQRTGYSVVVPKLEDFLEPSELFVVLDDRLASAPQRWGEASLQPFSCYSWSSQIYRRDSSILPLSFCTFPERQEGVGRLDAYLQQLKARENVFQDVPVLLSWTHAALKTSSIIEDVISRALLTSFCVS